jgi:hypothetical protein
MLMTDDVLDTIQRSDSEESLLILCKKCIELIHNALLVRLFFDTRFRITTKFRVRPVEAKGKLTYPINTRVISFTRNLVIQNAIHYYEDKYATENYII